VSELGKAEGRPRSAPAAPSSDPGAPRIRVLLVDDQALLRMGFRLVLEAS
jgi:hypothetical protein